MAPFEILVLAPKLVEPDRYFSVPGPCRDRGGRVFRRPKPLLLGAEVDARRLERERLPLPTALAQIVRAGVAGVRGNTEAARVHLISAADQFHVLDMNLVGMGRSPSPWRVDRWPRGTGPGGPSRCVDG